MGGCSHLPGPGRSDEGCRDGSVESRDQSACGGGYRGPAPGPSGSAGRVGAPESVRAAHRHHPVSPVHRRACEPGHPRPLPRLSRRRDPDACPPRRPRADDFVDRVLSRQGPLDPRLLPFAGGAARRRGAAHPGGARPAAGRWPQDGQRRTGRRLRNRLGGGGRHAHVPRGAEAASDFQRRPGGDRASVDGSGSSDRLGLFIDRGCPARPLRLSGASSPLQRLPAQPSLPVARSRGASPVSPPPGDPASRSIFTPARSAARSACFISRCSR